MQSALNQKTIIKNTQQDNTKNRVHRHVGHVSPSAIWLRIRVVMSSVTNGIAFGKMVSFA
jgi:hypothetical protein